MVQWLEPRTTNLKKWCRDNNYEHDSVDGQIAFCVHELKTSYRRIWDRLITENDLTELTKLVLLKYEIPFTEIETQEERKEWTKRLNFAHGYDNEL